MNIIFFSAGMVVGFFFSKKRFHIDSKNQEAYKELNEILLEKENRIEQLENYINQLLENGEITQDEISSSPSDEKDDLTLIEGIGPKTKEILNENGIEKFSQLAEKSLEELRIILATAGSVFLRHNPETWAQQASLAAKGEWEALKEWQNS